MGTSERLYLRLITCFFLTLVLYFRNVNLGDCLRLFEFPTSTLFDNRFLPKISNPWSPIIEASLKSSAAGSSSESLPRREVLTWVVAFKIFDFS